MNSQMKRYIELCPEGSSMQECLSPLSFECATLPVYVCVHPPEALVFVCEP